MVKKHETKSEKFLRTGGAGNSVATHWVLCLLIVLIGTVARLYNLGGESIDLEEYACLSAIDAPDYGTFFEQQRALYPYGAPLVPTLIYFWARIVGDSIVSIRLLVALAGIMTMLLGYGVARLLFPERAVSRRAALVMLLCIALSPVHVFHSQEARMYAFVSLFALGGMASFLLALNTGKWRWWGLHLAANVGLVASHYFAVFMLPVYGLVLLFHEKRITLRLVFWGIGHALLFIALFAWVSAIPRQAEELYSYYEMPTAYTVFIHTFAGDSTWLSATSFFPSTDSWYFLPQVLRTLIQASHLFFDGLLVVLSLMSLFAGALFLINAIRKSGHAAAVRWFLLLCWALLPVALIAILSLVWQPVYGSRYVMYSMFALYVLAGGMLSRLPGKTYYVGLLLVALLYGYQLSIALPPQTRSAWRQCYERVQQESGYNAVLLLEDPFFQPVLEINIDGRPPVPIVAAFNRSTLCEAATEFAVADAPDLWVLLVLTTDFDESSFVDCLENSNLRYERFYYPGERNLSLYKIIPSVSEAMARTDDTLFGPLIDAAFPDAVVEDVRYLADEEGGFWLRLGIDMAAYRQDTFAETAFRNSVRSSLSAALRLLTYAAQTDRTLDVVRLAQAALQLPAAEACDRLRHFMSAAYYADHTEFIRALGDAQPSCPESCLYKGIGLHNSGDHENAVFWFCQYPDLTKNGPPEVVEAYGISLTETEAYSEAVRVLSEGIERWPDYYWLYMRLGIAEAALGNHEAALSALRITYGHAPENTYLLYLMIESLVELGQYEEASLLASQPVIASGTEIWILWARWRAFTGANKDSEGQEVFRRITESMTELQPLYQCAYVEVRPEKVRQLLEEMVATGKQAFPEVYMLLDRLERK